MTGRDRLVVVGLVVLAVLAVGWIALVSPERKQAASLEGQVASARQALASAQTQAADARSAQVRYVEAYKSIVSLGKAVPPQQEIPSLIYELDQASHQRSIEFNSISSGNTVGSGSGASTGTSAAAAAASVFTTMPFTFVFKGSFFGLAHLLSQIDGFAQATPAQGGGSAAASTATVADISGVKVSGRLLTIQSVDLTQESGSSGLNASTGTGASGSGGELKAAITATAYVLPASQGLTAGATSAGPAGAATPSASQSTTASNSPAAPAVIRVAP
ncbi:MAG TPA: type II secretion system protein GspM [Solirubrobacteraceae bacterium]|nr:type II secretion system protein GspM [Solirubrobacteraceae bacterium]